jgi:hypothetical protein
VPEVGVRFRKGMSLAVISVDFLVDNIRDVESRAESVVCVTVTCLVYLYPIRFGIIVDLRLDHAEREARSPCAARGDVAMRRQI